MTIKGLRKFIPQLTSEQHVAARLAIKGLSHVLIASQMGVARAQVELLIEQVEALIGESLSRPEGTTHARDPGLAARYKRRMAKKAEVPDIEVAAGVYETCGFCGLRWHSENWPNGAPRCDLKIRRLESAYIGSALGAET